MAATRRTRPTATPADTPQRRPVDGEDEQFARAVLHPDLIEFLLTDPRQPRGFWLLGGHLDVLHEVGDHRDPDNLVPALDLRCDILDRIPQQVWS
ncbi:hypothetical protein [Haloechinothrix halophila]|uniref:hypothetical protein n=1 Tax=Haloechinothrix halophila TaxID=1069073 RepID=UPI000408AA70|nr:hypothetical protein [Haloechinothrix halophila]